MLARLAGSGNVLARMGAGLGRCMTLRSTVSSRSLGSDLAVSAIASVAAVAVTTIALLIVDSLAAVDHLVIAYLLPATLIAVYYGSTFAFLTSFASGLSAAYFLFPPKFSLYIAHPIHVAELGFFMLLALTASKAVAAVTHDVRLKRPAGAGSTRTKADLPTAA